MFGKDIWFRMKASFLCVFVRISPSEGDSIGSDPASDRGSPEEGTRPAGLPTDPKQTRKAAANGLNGKFGLLFTCYQIFTYHNTFCCPIELQRD